MNGRYWLLTAQLEVVTTYIAYWCVMFGVNFYFGLHPSMRWACRTALIMFVHLVLCVALQHPCHQS